jgi:hypothetical protein
MLSPFVLVILLQNYGFTVDFYNLEACMAMERKLAITASNVKCGARGDPVKIELKPGRNMHKAHSSPRRKRRPAPMRQEYFGGED